MHSIIVKRSEFKSPKKLRPGMLFKKGTGEKYESMFASVCNKNCDYFITRVDKVSAEAVKIVLSAPSIKRGKKLSRVQNRAKLSTPATS